jgi:HEAT repeat protein
MTITPESVQELLNSSDFGQRITAVNQLRQLERAIAYEMIKPLVNDENVRVRYAAVSQLASLGRENPQEALTILRDRLLNDPEPDVQSAAADSLGGLQLKEAFEDLEQVYNSTTEWLVKLSIVAALPELGDPRAFDLLSSALQAENELVQSVAVGAMAELGDRRAFPLLLPFVNHEDWQIRYRIVQAMGRLEGPEVQTALQILAHDKMEAVAQEAKALLKD